MTFLAVLEWGRALRRWWRRLNGRTPCCGVKRRWHALECDIGNPPTLSPWRGCGCGGDPETGYEHHWECLGYWPPAAARHRKAVAAGHAGEWAHQPPPAFYELPMGRRGAVSWAYGELRLGYPGMQADEAWRLALDAERTVREHTACTPICVCSPETLEENAGCICGARPARDRMLMQRMKEIP